MGEMPKAVWSGTFKAWRLRNGLTQRQAAKLLGRSERMIRHYERYKNLDDIPRAIRLAMHGDETRAGLAKAKDG